MKDNLFILPDMASLTRLAGVQFHSSLATNKTASRPTAQASQTRPRDDKEVDLNFADMVNYGFEADS
jgi:hypothetical protein